MRAREGAGGTYLGPWVHVRGSVGYGKVRDLISALPARMCPWSGCVLLLRHDSEDSGTVEESVYESGTIYDMACCFPYA